MIRLNGNAMTGKKPAKIGSTTTKKIPMMNRREEVLVILMEEFAEASRAASKIIRFGLDKKNIKQLESELGDVLAMMKLVDEECGLEQDRILAAAEKKLVKVEQFMTNKRLDNGSNDLE